MNLFYFVLPGAAAALAAYLLVTRLRGRKAFGKIPGEYNGAIRVTQQGRDMLIVKNSDGSFTMVEEKKVRTR
jgi:hypothetical protein